jgi:hypothetical protein
MDFELNTSLSGCCNRLANEAYFKIAEGTVALIKIQMLKNTTDNLFDSIPLKKYDTTISSDHTVLINWTSADQNKWLIIDPTYDAISMIAPRALDFKTYMKKLSGFYKEVPDVIRISWKVTEGAKPINKWIGSDGDITIDWNQIIN